VHSHRDAAPGAGARGRWSSVSFAMDCGSASRACHQHLMCGCRVGKLDYLCSSPKERRGSQNSGTKCPQPRGREPPLFQSDPNFPSSEHLCLSGISLGLLTVEIRERLPG
jgi:hypothetical protein